MTKTRGRGSYQPRTWEEHLIASIRNRRKKARGRNDVIAKEEAPVEEQQHAPTGIGTSEQPKH